MKTQMIYFLFILSIVMIIIVSCKSTSKINPHFSKADLLVQHAISTHGGKKYDTAHYQFIFRDKIYTFKNNHDQYEYTVISKKEGRNIKTVLNNDGLYQTGKPNPLTPKQKKGTASTLNSVIYFATLPHKLNDPAVIKNYIGSTQIKNKTYAIVEISFTKEGGGSDHDDIFYYWINKETFTIDYLAYNYQVNNGGVRFRSAYNRRNVGGILFQDYVNYKAEVDTPLKDLPLLWEQDKLKELSRIETQQVTQVKHQNR